jgi:hypothetical protein
MRNDLPANMDLSRAHDTFTETEKAVINSLGVDCYETCSDFMERARYLVKSFYYTRKSLVSAYNLDVRKDLCKNIILSRGSTMYESLAERLKNEITNLAADGA